jgi:hypothetical protein
MGTTDRFPSALSGSLRRLAPATIRSSPCSRPFRGNGRAHGFLDPQIFSITFSFTAHANDIFAPRDFEIGLDKLVDTSRVIVTETDYAEQFCENDFQNAPIASIAFTTA